MMASSLAPACDHHDRSNARTSAWRVTRCGTASLMGPVSQAASRPGARGARAPRAGRADVLHFCELSQCTSVLIPPIDRTIAAKRQFPMARTRAGLSGACGLRFEGVHVKNRVATGLTLALVSAAWLAPIRAQPAPSSAPGGSPAAHTPAAGKSGDHGRAAAARGAGNFVATRPARLHLAKDDVA